MKQHKIIDTIEEQATWYDATFERMGGCWTTPSEEWAAHLDRMGLPQHSERRLRVLDIGCADGSFLYEATRRRNVWGWGVDLSKWIIGQAIERQRLNPFVTFWQGDALEVMRGLLSYESGHYDYIVSLGSLEHMLNVPGVLDEVRRLLKTDGTWYFYTPNEKWLHFDQATELTGTNEEWRELFTTHGLTVRDEWTNGDCTAFWGGKA